MVLFTMRTAPAARILEGIDMARAKKPTVTPEANEAADAAKVVTETSNLIVRAATGRMITAEQSEKVQPTINALWSAGGPTRDLILRVADQVARECEEDKALKNNALSILRVRASRAQKAAGDPEQGIILRTGVAAWGEPKTAKVRDYLGEALATLAKGVEAGQVPADRLEKAAQVLLGTVVQGTVSAVRTVETPKASSMPVGTLIEPTPEVPAVRSLLQRLRLVA
jgi:hypothetical protein